jgi:3-mercaptopyruvate sulfurtransferase SseA
MRTDTEWQAEVKGMLRAEMTRRGITYDQLAAKLAEIGVKVDPHVLRNKVARGGFSAVFFVQCLRAMGCQTVRLVSD